MADTKKFKTGIGIGKKIVLGIGIAFGIFIAIGITGSLLSNDSKTIQDSSSIQPSQAGSEIQEKLKDQKIIPLGEKDNPAKIGDTLVTENIAYKVTKVSKAESIGDSFIGDKADGIFLIIDLSIENKGNESIEILSDYFTLIDSQGREFDTDNNAWIYLKENVFLKQLQPSLPTTGQIIFDLPTHNETYTLEISGGVFSFDKKYVMLGPFRMEESISKPTSPSQPLQTTSSSKNCSGSAGCYTDYVTRIVDGDTIHTSTLKIRLSLTNTPETYQDGFSEATQFTEKLCPVGSRIQVDQDDLQPIDKYGRILAKVLCGDKVLNSELLYNGYANILTQYCSTSEFSDEDWAKRYGC